MEKADSAFDRLVFRNPAPRAGSRIGDAAADQIDIGLDPRALDPEDRRQRQRRIHRERVARAVADIADDIEYPPAFVTQDCVIDDVGDAFVARLDNDRATLAEMMFIRDRDTTGARRPDRKSTRLNSSH